MPSPRKPRHSRAHDQLGEAMRRLRLEQDITQEDLAFKAGLHRTFVSELEIGHRNPTYASLLRVAKALGTPLSEWIARAEPQKRSKGQAKPRSARARSARGRSRKRK